MPLRLSPSSLCAIQPFKTLGFPRPTSLNLRTLSHRPLFPKSSVRLASRWESRRTQYNRFENAQTHSSPALRRYGFWIVGLGGVAFYVGNLEKVPITGRRRFNCISPARETAMAESQYRRILQHYGPQVLPSSHPHSKLVKKVLGRLIVAAGLEAQNWDVKVIEDPEQQNAFVLPGGKVFVFSGILPICADEDGLAAVLGHEIAHNLAHHTGEQLSRERFLFAVGAVVGYSLGIYTHLTHDLLDVAFELPGSRQMESEADYIGLLMMAQACYDPNAAVRLWQRMASAEKGAPLQILSTHPASEKRMKVIQDWLPQAQQKRAASECGITTRYMDEFTTAFGHGGEDFW